MVELEVRATDFRGGVLCGQGDIAGGGGAGTRAPNPLRSHPTTSPLTHLSPLVSHSIF